MGLVILRARWLLAVTPEDGPHPGQLVDPAGADLHVRLYVERQMRWYAERHIRLYTHTHHRVAPYLELTRSDGHRPGPQPRKGCSR